MQYLAFFSYCKILVIFRTYLLISIFLLLNYIMLVYIKIELYVQEIMDFFRIPHQTFNVYELWEKRSFRIMLNHIWFNVMEICFG